MEEGRHDGSTTPESATVGARKRRTKFAVGGLVVVVAIAGLVVWAMTRPGSTSFYMTVSEVAAGPPAATAEDFRVTGNVVPGTLVEDGVETTFDITDGELDLTVVTDEALPDAFYTGYENDASAIEVVAQGRLGSDGSTFAASKVLAKCPSKFKTQT
jgi:cytochrome c-type biogenesis protein CcmE